ncbi:O-antigen ligase family protein [Nguyenibacter vanlangensis]|uniref:O-antigen ligase family protein n=2 Tax=Nguyenibacter TaxID=1519186 RepID=A0ABZ3D6E4_9PROT
MTADMATRRSRVLAAGLWWIALALTMALPLFQLRGRAIGDGIMSAVGILFLVQCRIERAGTWWRRGWFPFALAFCGLAVLSSLLHGSRHAVGEAAVLVRFFLFAAALEHWVLRGAAARRRLGTVLGLVAAWLVVECWQQYLLGHNLLGYPRWPDGALTGPFYEPRAATPLLMTAFAGAMPVALRWMTARGWPWRAAGAAIVMLLVLTMVLIGQRMPALLFGLGLALTALFVRWARLPVLLAAVAGGVGLALLPVLSPPAYAKLVVHFLQQIRHFSDSAYGQIYIRAAAIVRDHPWLGLGADGFRDFCADPAYVHGVRLFGLDLPARGAAEGCNIHPHNIYLEVATTAGLPGLACFMAMAALWLGRMIRALDPGAAPQQAMLCVICCVVLWPVASSSALFSARTAGWIFLLVGWGLAAARDVAGEARLRRV